MAGSWAIGAVINVIGSILINLGTNVMKLGHNKRAASSNLPDKEKPSVRKFREWQIGVALFSIGNVLNFASFGFAAQSLLAALGSIQFVSNVIFSKLVLGEKASKRVLMATACIVGGCILLVSFGNHQSQTLTVEDMLHNYRSAVYIVYLVLLAISVVAFYLVYRFGKRKLVKVGQTNLSTYWMRLLPVSYALFSGMLGTQSVLFSKTLSTLIRTSIKGDSQVDSWFFWFIIVCLIATAFFWVSRLNKALKLFPAIIIVPTMQISWTLFSIISGGVYFKEYLTFTKLSATMFALGVLIVFAGVYLLTPAQKKELKDLQEQFMRHDSEDDLPDHQPGDMALVDVEQASSALASGGAELRQKTAQRSANHTEDKENLYSGELSHASVSALRIRTSDTGSAHHSTRPTCPAGSIHGGNGHHGHAAGSGRPPTTGGLATDRSFVEDVMDDFSISPREGFAELLGISEDSRMGAVSVFGGMPLVELGPTLNDEISLPSISEPAASGADCGEWSPRGAVARKSASRSLRDASGLLSPGGLRRVLSPTFRGYDELDSPGAAEQLEEPLRPDALSSQLDDDG
ncbi:hypothetical protein WJX72_009403 [[Myrmecia] bisecta]|uniref:Probable magnesium transporter n=1 Tax=[Myrmecia] bisecta TaxID=41462 RepID=A0AAW1QT38_9CHLO